jgi:hypothetical protein
MCVPTATRWSVIRLLGHYTTGRTFSDHSSSSFLYGTIFSDPLLTRLRGDLAYPIPHAMLAALSPIMRLCVDRGK